MTGEVKTTKTVEELREEYQKKLRSEVDRRVTQAVQKTEKRLQEQFKTKNQHATERKRILEIKLEIINALIDQGMDAKFKEFIDVVSFIGIEEQDKRYAAILGKVETLQALFSSLLEKETGIYLQKVLGVTPGALGSRINLMEKGLGR